MRKKLVLKNKFRFALIISVFFLLACSTVFASSAYGYREPQYKYVSVAAGDTLWGIASRYKNSEDIRKYIYKIKKINNLKTSMIYEGEVIKIPE